MKRVAVLLAALVLAVLLPHASAEPWALEWEQDVGPGYITTSPLVDEERVYVRTSGFWTGEERPEVMAFTHQGVLEWSYSSPTTVQHDMAPMLKVEAGSGPCGSWPDLLLVGWADGAFTALHPSNGTLHWQANSNVSGWGITGASLIEGDDAVIPTRNGLMRLCMADGTLEFSVELGEGWRNGVTSFDDAYWLGDEEGQLWAVERNGTVRASYSLPRLSSPCTRGGGRWLVTPRAGTALESPSVVGHQHQQPHSNRLTRCLACVAAGNRKHVRVRR
ncbi:MAG: hypothetical protein CM15mP78_02610 [Candidatus Poseidoniales archaeon]|nr:MAG: hypothetical protein CM15mP78_02610 [Candidatus Poseidoniales archaeon]